MENVGGRKYSDTMSKVNVKKCGPCKETGVVKDADTFCLQCDEYMCTDCAASHKSFKMLRNHTLLSGNDLPLIGVSHRKCQVTSISDAAAAHGQRLAEVVGSMSEMKERIGNLKNRQEKSGEDLMKLQKSFEDEVNQFKTDIVELVERLAKEMLADMNKVVTVEKDVILDHVKAYDSLIPKVETELRTADEAKAAADGVISVIAAHKMSNTLKSLEPTVSDLLGKVEIERTNADGVDPPGSGPIHPASTWRSFTDIEVESSTDIKVPDGNITGSAVLPDGRIILVGFEESQVILLDRNFNVQTTLKLQNQPWDVAADGDTGAIVSLHNRSQLQLIHVDGELRAGRIVNTSLPCRGVAVHGDHIYVTVTLPDDSHVQVLDRRGTVTRYIGLDASGAGTFIDPCYITVGARGHMFFTDNIHKGRIACFTNGGDLVYSVDHEDMKNPTGLAADGDDNVIVCCYNSQDVHVLRKDGSRHRVVLSSADGVVTPHSVTYIHSDNTLIVTMNNTPYCRAYKLK